MTNKFAWDISVIDITDTNEMEYWVRLWNVSREKIIEAVNATGSNHSDIVELYLIINGEFK